MECHNFIWEEALSFIPLNERKNLRCLSKAHNHLALRSMDQLRIKETKPDDLTCFDRFGPHTNHLFLDGFNKNLAHLANSTKNVTHITFGENFTFYDRDGELLRSSEELSDQTVILVNQLKLKSISFNTPKKSKFIESIIENRDLLSFSLNVNENPLQAHTILRQLSFKYLKQVGVSSARIGNHLNRLLEKKAVCLKKINLHGCVEACEGSYSLPQIPSLEEIRLNLRGDKFIVKLDNPDSLPFLNKIDLNFLTSSFNIGNIRIWPNITVLRLHMVHFQDIDLHHYFPSLLKLSYRLTSAPPKKALEIISPLRDIKSLFVYCPRLFELPGTLCFASLQCLSLKIRHELNPDFVSQLTVSAPKLAELSINSTRDYFETIFLETDCHFASLLRFISKNNLSYQFWERLVKVAPVLVDIHNDDCVFQSENLKRITSGIRLSPFYEIEDLVFGRLSRFN